MIFQQLLDTVPQVLHTSPVELLAKSAHHVTHQVVHNSKPVAASIFDNYILNSIFACAGVLLFVSIITFFSAILAAIATAIQAVIELFFDLYRLTVITIETTWYLLLSLLSLLAYPFQVNKRKELKKLQRRLKTRDENGNTARPNFEQGTKQRFGRASFHTEDLGGSNGSTTGTQTRAMDLGFDLETGHRKLADFALDLDSYNPQEYLLYDTADLKELDERTIIMFFRFRMAFQTLGFLIHRNLKVVEFNQRILADLTTQVLYLFASEVNNNLHDIAKLGQYFYTEFMIGFTATPGQYKQYMLALKNITDPMGLSMSYKEDLYYQELVYYSIFEMYEFYSNKKLKRNYENTVTTVLIRNVLSDMRKTFIEPPYF